MKRRCRPTLMRNLARGGTSIGSCWMMGLQPTEHSTPLSLMGTMRAVDRFGCWPWWPCGSRALSEGPKTVGRPENPESAASAGREGLRHRHRRGAMPGDGSIAIVDPSGKITTFATGWTTPKGVVVVGTTLYVATSRRSGRSTRRGRSSLRRPRGVSLGRRSYFNDIRL